MFLTPTYFTLGERRVVRIVCIELKTPTECEWDGITLTMKNRPHLVSFSIG